MCTDGKCKEAPAAAFAAGARYRQQALQMARDAVLRSGESPDALASEMSGLTAALAETLGMLIATNPEIRDAVVAAMDGFTKFGRDRLDSVTPEEQAEAERQYQREFAAHKAKSEPAFYFGKGAIA